MVSARALVVALSTAPESVTTPLVEFTAISGTVESPTSDASFDLTLAVISMSFTCAAGVSLVRQPVSNADDVRSALAKSGDRPPLLLINRRGQTIFLAVPLH